ncbi:MAG: hypothetical protein D8M58_09905 [Calditrichaeota bacterium]|nr:MAG: hypothetical protein DWQ03_09280 [Calditrichota bacterium]MBL1205702.1 hypothetical protein [Calditrichota bacterium]NOG45530.1 hypothetical protein [Calditrichota bacterium]
MKIFNLFFIVTLFAFFGCSLDTPSETATVLSTGDANFTSYAALGNSLTAGYQSGALTERHQQYSYVNFIAQQAGVTTFQQPLIGYPGIGTNTEDGGGIIELTALDGGSGSPLLTPAALADYPSFNPLMPWASDAVRDYPAPYNNLGVPGAVLWDVMNATSSANSGAGTTNNTMFDVILRNPNLDPIGGQSFTAFQQAKLLQATFITCWIGNNDVLGYATSGGTSPAAPTDQTTFGFLYGVMLDSLVATGADVVLANIPDVTAIPFFTTVPYKVDPGTGTEVALVISTADGPRQATADDFILLTGSSLIGDVSGTYGPAGVPVGFDGSAPMPNSVVLDEDEIAVAKAAVSGFNSTIASLASAKNVPVVDVNSIFNDIHAHGREIAGLTFTTSFITGGLFSLDGVHPSDLGSAIIANEFLTTINENFDASIPLVNVIDVMEDISLKKSSSQITYNKETFDNVVKLFGGK